MTEEKLARLITKYATSYYSGLSEVSDVYFDSLVDELRKINPDHEILKTPGWGYEPTRKYKHWWNLKIGSLSKVKEGQTIPSQYLRDNTRISAKLDGLSVVSYYINGRRIQSLTRGNGSEGLDVTSKINLIDPSSEFVRNPDNTPFNGAVRGEVVMPTSIWHDVYEIQKDSNPSLNPRNIAAGLMNRKEDSPELQNLRYVVYKVLYSEGYEYKDMIDQLFFFDAHWNFVKFSHKGEIERQYDGLENFYKSCCEDYPCDGLVFSNYEDGMWDEIAYKFQAESVEVKVSKVTWSASRTGRLNPIIWFDPVELSGAMVQKCTGFNAAFIRDNLIGTGAIIEVCRSNEVIPTCMRVIEPVDNVDLPKVCPNCCNEIHWDGVDLVCDNENEAQLAYHFISTLAPLDGAGYALYKSIIETFSLDSLDSLSYFLRSFRRVNGEDVFDIDYAIDWMKSKRTLSGEVTTEKVRKVFEKLLGKVSPVRFLVACNIPGVSYNTAESILQEYPDFIKDLIGGRFYLDDILKIKGLGYAVLDSLRQFKSRIIELGSVLNFEEVVVKPKAQFKVAITGSLSMKRADFDQELKARGIEQSGNFKEIKYLITNNPDSGSSKMQNAKKYGVEIISEENFKNKYLK